MNISLSIWLIIFSALSNLQFFQHPKPKVITAEFIFEEAPFKACHASTIVELENGKIMCAWFGGANEGAVDVKIWCSVRDGRSWSKPKIIATGKENGKSSPCWNPVLFKTKAGLLMLFYKVGPNPRAWWGEMKTSNDNGKTWSEAARLPYGLYGPIKNKPIQLENGQILYGSSTESLDEKTWSIHLEKSDSKGTNFKKIEIDNGIYGVIQPSILKHKDGSLQLLCRSRQNVVVSTWSKDDGETWQPLKALDLPNPNSGTDAVSLVNGKQLLVYNPLTAGQNWWEGRSVLKLASSTNGTDWNDIYTLENHKKGEYSYPAIIQSTDGHIHITYTSERKKIKYIKLAL